MAESTVQLGVLTSTQHRAGKTDTGYVTGWIDCRLAQKVFFRQNSLLNKAQVAELADGQLLFFSVAPKKLEEGEKIEAVECSLVGPAQLLEYLVALKKPAIRTLGKRASPDLRNALLPELEKLINSATEPRVVACLKAVKSELTPRVDEPRNVEQAATSAEPPATVVTQQEGHFLRNILTSNSSDYASQLFPLLVEGIKTIADDDSFRQALFLLEFNDQLPEGKIDGLHHAFYGLSAPTYRLQFWLRGLVPYCDTDVLLNEFTNGTDDQKASILQRCQGNISDLLVAPTPAVNPPVLHACFHNIKNTLLSELAAAQVSIQVAVAWFTHDELFAVLCEKLQQNVVVELIINNDYINNWEFGLPFAKFIELGGQLYLSEHPAMMHHKFCLIDGATLCTGSFNWTYYADLYNQENMLCIENSPEVLASFKSEFEHVKQLLGSPVTSITPLPAGELVRFERVGFRNYISKDIQSRVAYTQATRPAADPQQLAAMLGKAIEIDDNNSEAREMLQQVAPAAAIDGYAIRAQQTVQEQSNISANPELTVSSIPSAPVMSEPVSAPEADVDAKETKAVVAPAPPAAPKPAVLQQAPPVLASIPASSRAVTLLPLAGNTPSRSTAAPVPLPSAVVLPRKTTSSPTSAAPQPVDTSISIPDSQRKEGLYDNLRLVFALDYSNSMESGGQGHSGYKLYSTGKIQQVINMIFGVAKGLIPAGQFDMFLFEKKAIQLPEVTENNYASYIQDVVMTHKMNGTNIYSPIKAIHDKYPADSTAKTGVFVILITDGENNEEEDSAKIKSYFASNANAPIFWQFVGLGAKFAFLEEVAEKASNAAFFSLNDVQNISNDTLLEMLLGKFPQWYNKARTESIIIK